MFFCQRCRLSGSIYLKYKRKSNILQAVEVEKPQLKTNTTAIKNLIKSFTA